MKAHTILADRYHKTTANASARLSETEARARQWKDTRYATLNARQHQFIRSWRKRLACAFFDDGKHKRDACAMSLIY